MPILVMMLLIGLFAGVWGFLMCFCPARWDKLTEAMSFAGRSTEPSRIFSVVFYYHFAFLAISIALFGLGAGGVFSYVVSGWNGSLFLKLGRLSLLNGLLVVLALIAVLSQTGGLSNLRLLLVYFATSLPRQAQRLRSRKIWELA